MYDFTKKERKILLNLLNIHKEQRYNVLILRPIQIYRVLRFCRHYSHKLSATLVWISIYLLILIMNLYFYFIHIIFGDCTLNVSHF